MRKKSSDLKSTGRSRNNFSAVIGVTFIFVGFFFNKWLFEWALIPDGKIELASNLFLIYLFQAASLISGTYFLAIRPAFFSLNKRDLALSLIGLLIPLLCLETGFRVWEKYFLPDQYNWYKLYTEASPNEMRYLPHPYLNYYNNPGYDIGSFSHNRLGYRGDDFPLKKPEGVFRIVTLGGSTTYSTGIPSNEKTYPAYLEKYLGDDYGIKNVEVINAGAGHYTTWESLVNLEFRSLDVDPDLIIVYHAINDVMARLVPPSSYRGDNSGGVKQWDPPSVGYWQRSLFLRFLAIKAGLVPVYGLTHFVLKSSAGHRYEKSDYASLLKKNPPIYYRRNLRNMIAISKEHGVKIMFATWAYSPFFPNDVTKMDVPDLQEAIKEHNGIMIEIARSHGIPVFDFAAVMPKDKQYWADGAHVNEKGGEIKGRLFAKFISENGIIEK